MKYIGITIGLILGGMFHLSGQPCDGALGENIFTDGDFGSGSATVLVPDPQISPSYFYDPTPPPYDGSYTVANSTAGWAEVYGWYWASIGDNSPDPNGYMMVVNASYAPGLFYRKEVEGLCENTFYQFSADVFNMGTGLDIIKPNVSFLLDGVSYYETGDIPEDLTWHTYGFTFTTGPGQTSMTLSLRNNAPGGIGNDLALDNISFRPCGPEAFILPDTIETICEEDFSPVILEATIVGNAFDTPVIQWQLSTDGLTWQNIPGATGTTYTHTDLSGGAYHYRFLLANSLANLASAYCRVISNEKIVYVVPKFYSLTDTLCEGFTYQLGNEEWGASGIYQDTFVSFLGCDSIVTLDLTIVPNSNLQAAFDILPPTCSYLENGGVGIEILNTAFPPYSIFIDSVPYGNTLEISGLAGGLHEIEIRDRIGCQLVAEFEIETPAPFLVDLGPDQEVSLGDPVTISPTSNYTIAHYSWQPAGWVDCVTGCGSVDFFPTSSGYLSLLATSDPGCLTEDSLFIKVNDDRRVFIPNIFSPNGDGINDRFTILGQVPNVQEIEELLVFDSWGGLVFRRSHFLPNEEAQGWDGTANGKRSGPGVYVYWARVRFLNGKVAIYSGDLTLVE